MKSKKNVEESALTSTLLSSTSFDEARGRHMSGEKGETRGRRVTNVDKNNPEMCQAYANNQPKIMLETINARTITVRNASVVNISPERINHYDYM